MWVILIISLEMNNSLVALGLGAKIFEKHFKINNSINSPDAESSINFEEMKNYVNMLNIGFKSLGNAKQYRKLQII